MTKTHTPDIILPSLAVVVIKEVGVARGFTALSVIRPDLKKLTPGQ